MQQFCIINLKHLITTTCMAIKPDKNELWYELFNILKLVEKAPVDNVILIL